MLTNALIIGVSHYREKTFSSLPGAEKDALTLARALRNWGIPEERITLFLNEEATTEEIYNYIELLSKEKKEFKFLFYFCGHGFRKTVPLPTSYLLLSESTLSCQDALSLDLLMKKISRLNASESYLFIDACYLRVNTIIHPMLEGELEGKKNSKKSLFCLLSSGIEPSFEDSAEDYGYFTEALLKALCETRTSETSFDFFSRLIQENLREKKLPLPESYAIGIQAISLIPNTSSPFLQEGQVHRTSTIATIQDQIIKNRGKSLSLIGKAGIGKSTLCQQLVCPKFKVYYIDLELSEKEDGSFWKKLEEECPTVLFILDHIDQLIPKQLETFCSFLRKRKTPIIFVSRNSLKPLLSEEQRRLFTEWECPPFSKEESSFLISQEDSYASEEDKELLYLSSHGNPSKIRKALATVKNSSEAHGIENEGMRKAIAAISSCGMFIDETLFIQVLELEEKSLDLLKEMGLITYSNGVTEFHDLLYSIAESEKLIAPKEKVLSYWRLELERHPEHLEIARQLILCVKCFGYEAEIDPALQRAFQILQNSPQEELSTLKEGADIFLKEKRATKASLFLAELLVEAREGDLAFLLLSRKIEEDHLIFQAKLCYAHFLWRYGKFDSCIQLTSEMIKYCKEENKILFYIHRGISYFFLGRWEEAKIDFQLIYEKSKDERYLGWSMCMLGTILGVRGLDLKQGRAFIELGVRALVKIKDFGGAWLGSNNLGEILWKSGRYGNAAAYLHKALGFARQVKNKAAEFESLRNLLQLQLRIFHPFAKEVEDLLVEMEAVKLSSLQPFERMQALNSLATVYIFRGNIKKGLSLIKEAIPLTKKSEEYHIYTLANLSLLYKMHQRKKKADSFLQKALELAKKGGNLLAIQQIEYDFALIERSCLTKER